MPRLSRTLCWLASHTVADRLLASDAAADRGLGSAGDGGFGLDDGAAQPSWIHLAHVLFGTALVIVGAIALNQRLECAGDAKMPRTADRPLPSGRLSRRQVTTFGLAATALGLAYLAIAAGPMLTLLAAIGWLMYVGIYTPLKSRSAWQTPIGAAAGAMPVLLGAAAGGQSLSPWALVLFGIVFCWQFPHSMAIAWRLSARIRRGASEGWLP